MFSVRAVRQTLRFFVNPVQCCAVRESDSLYRCVRCLLEFQPTLRSVVRPRAVLNILRFVSRSSCCPDEEVFASLSVVAHEFVVQLMSLHEAACSSFVVMWSIPFAQCKTLPKSTLRCFRGCWFEQLTRHACVDEIFNIRCNQRVRCSRFSSGNTPHCWICPRSFSHLELSGIYPPRPTHCVVPSMFAHGSCHH